MEKRIAQRRTIPSQTVEVSVLGRRSTKWEAEMELSEISLFGASLKMSSDKRLKVGDQLSIVLSGTAGQGVVRNIAKGGKSTRVGVELASDAKDLVDEVRSAATEAVAAEAAATADAPSTRF